MMETSEKLAPVPDRALIYHQGLPVAVCPVAALEGQSLQLVCGILRFEPQARLRLQFLAPRPTPLEAQRPGIVEGSDNDGVRIRLESQVD